MVSIWIKDELNDSNFASESLEKWQKMRE